MDDASPSGRYLTCPARRLLSSQRRGPRATQSPEVVHGGSVCNTYGYPAETEGCVIVASPRGTAHVIVRRLPANKVTARGVVATCLGSDSAWCARFDDRIAASTWEIARHFARREADALAG